MLYLSYREGVWDSKGIFLGAAFPKKEKTKEVKQSFVDYCTLVLASAIDSDYIAILLFMNPCIPPYLTHRLDLLCAFSEGYVYPTGPTR